MVSKKEEKGTPKMEGERREKSEGRRQYETKKERGRHETHRLLGTNMFEHERSNRGQSATWVKRFIRI